MNIHYEKLSARKYYGNHATGSVVLRNGLVVFHGKPADASRLYEKFRRESLLVELPHTNVGVLGMKESDFRAVWIVVTTVNDGERDTFADVVLVTRDKTKAEKLVAKLKKHKVKLDWLSEYDSAAFFSRTIDSNTL